MSAIIELFHLPATDIPADGEWIQVEAQIVIDKYSALRLHYLPKVYRGLFRECELAQGLKAMEKMARHCCKNFDLAVDEVTVI